MTPLVDFVVFAERFNQVLQTYVIVAPAVVPQVTILKRAWLASNGVLDSVLAFAKRAKSAGYAKSPCNGFSRTYGSLTGQSLSRAGKISSCVNRLSAHEKIGPVNELLTSQSTCLFKRFAAYFR
jgi:hypothetical protein